MKKIIFLGLSFLVLSCKQKENKVTTTEAVGEVKNEVTSVANPFTLSIENAHQKNTFLSKHAVSFDIEVAFGGTTILDGTLTQLTDGSKIRIDKKDGATIVFDNQDAFIYPKEVEDPMARFHIFTWSYFFGMPYKLNDKGTQWSGVSDKKWGAQETMYPTAKLTFDKGTGDAPDDWYVVYKNPTTNVMEGSAYIVSFGKDLAKAEKEPHAIKYNNFKSFEGVPFSTHWTFHMWNDAEGYGTQIGEARLTNLKFKENTGKLFKKPESYTLLEAPITSK